MLYENTLTGCAGQGVFIHLEIRCLTLANPYHIKAAQRTGIYVVTESLLLIADYYGNTDGREITGKMKLMAIAAKRAALNGGYDGRKSLPATNCMLS